MGMNPSASISFGHVLGGCAEVGGWQVHNVKPGATEYHDNIIDVSWYDHEGGDDFVDAVQDELVHKTYPETTDFNLHKWELRQRLSVDVIFSGSGDFKNYLLVAKASVKTVEWAETKIYGPFMSFAPYAAWRLALEQAIEMLGLRPTQEKPGWILSALYF